jgi:hypothetical protein
MANFVRFERFVLFASSFVLLAFVGCATTDAQQPEASSPTAAASEATSPETGLVSGRYMLQGVTVQASNGQSRAITGTMELRVSDGEYTARYITETVIPGDVVPFEASVVGEGTGVVRGSSMVGTTTSTIRPDPAEGEGTLQTGAADELRVVSTVISDLKEDGSIVIRLLNEPVEGSDYSPSVSIFNAYRVGDLIDVASGPP